MYKQLPEDVEEKKTSFTLLFGPSRTVMEKMQANLLKRMRACFTMDSGHFEHLL